MTLPTTEAAIQFLNVVAATPVNCPFPLYSGDEVQVVYGQASLIAQENVDYTVALTVDFNSFTVTPLAALITKINNLIAADLTGQEINYIVIRRALSGTSSIASTNAGYTTVLANEISRLWMEASDTREKLQRVLTLPDKELGQVIPKQTFPNAASRAKKAVIFDNAGNITVSTENFEETMANLATALAAVSTGLAEIDANVITTQTYANEAGVSAAQAQQAAMDLQGTSNTPLVIGAGPFTLTTQAGKQFAPPAYILLASALTPANSMTLQVTAYNAGTGVLTGNVVGHSGAGAFASWNLSISGPPGPQGIQGPPGAGGAGSGDVVAANHGSEYIAAAAAFRANIGLDTMATQSAAGVNITGGTIANINPLAIASGGTGQATALGAFNALKQQGTTGYQGTLQLATNAETITGVDAAKATTPAGVAAAIAAATAGIASGVVVQHKYNENVNYSVLTVTIPVDDTVPLIAEGTQILTLNITPLANTNKLRIRANCMFATFTSGYTTMAIFDGNTCLYAKARLEGDSSNKMGNIASEFEYVPGDTNPHTISVRLGASTNNVYLNGVGISSRTFGGVSRATLVVDELTP